MAGLILPNNRQKERDDENANGSTLEGANEEVRKRAI